MILIGSSSCGPSVRAWVAPTSAMVTARSSSLCSTSALCSCSMHRMRNSTFVDQSVVSNALRAAAIARSASATPALGA